MHLTDFQIGRWFQVWSVIKINLPKMFIRDSQSKMHDDTIAPDK